MVKRNRRTDISLLRRFAKTEYDPSLQETSCGDEYHLRNLEQILLPSVNLVSFDTEASYVCGRLRAELEKKGQRLDLADLEIASIAIAGDFTLVTGNIRHFGRIEGLRAEEQRTAAVVGIDPVSIRRIKQDEQSNSSLYRTST